MSNLKQHDRHLAGWLKTLEDQGIHLFFEQGKLRYQAPQGAMTAAVIEKLRQHKHELMVYLSEPEWISDAAAAHEPFPLTEIQTAYRLGAGSGMPYGGLSCQSYMEIEYAFLDADKVKACFDALVAIHPMLRAVINPDGTQRVLESVPEWQIECMDLRTADRDFVDRCRSELAERMGHIVYEGSRWPHFTLAISRTRAESRLHISVDFIVADWASVWSVLTQFEHLYSTGCRPEPPVLTFRDYIGFRERRKQTRAYAEAERYWEQRLDDFPEAPALPQMAAADLPAEKPRFTRYCMHLPAIDWDRIRQQALHYEVTPTAVVMAVYALVLAKWSEHASFALNLTLLNRDYKDPAIHEIVGDFTTVILLNCRLNEPVSFIEQVRTLARQLYSDMDHALYSGVDVLRKLWGRRQRLGLYPYVFTSALGIANYRQKRMSGKYCGGITQTPQVFIDCQASDADQSLTVNWDVRDGIFEPALIQDMFEVFQRYLTRLSLEPALWEQTARLPLPCRENARRAQINAVRRPFEVRSLIHDFLQRADRAPGRPAVRTSGRSCSYGELADLTRRMAACLLARDLPRGACIGVAVGKSVEQIAAALAVLYIGGIYVPLDPDQGLHRIRHILKQSDIRCLFAESDLEKKNPKIRAAFADLPVVTERVWLKAEPVQTPPSCAPDDICYIIYTSGSTGEPKGVTMTHRAVMNTIDDVNARFGVGADDRIFAVSKLNFDLSVYDIFGLLSAGGSLVLPGTEQRPAPGAWHTLMHRHPVTVWNSVPALLTLYLDYLETLSDRPIWPELRLVLLSGDWVLPELVSRLQRIAPQAELVALGGATEAAIWSIYHRCVPSDAQRTSIPYGRPLSNQRFCILKPNLDEAPAGVTGELYIAGDGLAQGYWRAPELTAAGFPTDPVTGARFYRTGDYGRYLPDGEIEFLGRRDDQVKINGHRIELGEIEAHARRCTGVKRAMAGLADGRLVLFVLPEEPKTSVDPVHIRSALAEHLPDYMVPQRIETVADWPLTSNGKTDRALLIRQAGERCPHWDEPERHPAAAPDVHEQTVRKVVETVLGTAVADVHDSLYEYGADSLSMSRMTAALLPIFPEGSHDFDRLLAFMMNHPTVCDIAAFFSNPAGLPAHHRD